ncbi:MAG: sugar ABC transporter permease [Clostridia bacterium]|nr:sugar ABC transporter permease [Clostridia bacterium]
MSEKTVKRPVARKDMSKLQWTLKEMRRNYIGYIFILPFMFIFFLFTIVPVALSSVVSLTDFNLLEWPNFVFMDNYIRLFLDDDLFITAVKNTIIFAVITGPSSYLLSLFTAWFINELPPKVRAVITLIFYAPSISGGATMIWTTLFANDSYGWMNGWLLKLGLIQEPILWFQNTTYIVPLCIMVSLWTSLGTSFLAFIAGLQGINRSLFEAGSMDGIKNRWQELWYITLPSMKDQLMFGAVMAITGAFGYGGIVTSLCGFPSTDYVAYTISHHLDDYGGSRYEIGYASAISFVLFLMMMGCNLLIQKLLRKVGQ